MLSKWNNLILWSIIFATSTCMRTILSTRDVLIQRVMYLQISSISKPPKADVKKIIKILDAEDFREDLTSTLLFQQMATGVSE